MKKNALEYQIMDQVTQNDYYMYTKTFTRDYNMSVVPSPDKTHEHIETTQYRLVCIDLYTN